MGLWERVQQRTQLRRERIAQSRQAASLKRSNFYLEPLEARLLLSADVAPISAANLISPGNHPNPPAVVLSVDNPRTAHGETAGQAPVVKAFHGERNGILAPFRYLQGRNLALHDSETPLATSNDEPLAPINSNTVSSGASNVVASDGVISLHMVLADVSTFLSGHAAAILDPLVNIPTNLTGVPGGTITVPVSIENATGLESVDIGNFGSGLPGITYDTTILDATSASVRPGTVLPADSTIIANVDDTNGTIFVAISLNPLLPIPQLSGSIVLIDFQIKSTAAGGTTPIDLRRVSLNEGGLALTPAPQPGPDPTDGMITIGSNGGQNRPPVVDDQTFTVAENSSNGTTVGLIAATDPDAGQALAYSVTSGTGQSAFAVNAATGQITVANGSLLNFETTPSFTLNVTVTDNGTPQLSDTALITIDLNNVNEAPVVNAAMFSVAENSADGTAVGTVVATDPDAGQTPMLIYTITGGNTGGAFAINGSTGAITVANSAALDFEATPSFSLTIQATDTGTPVLSGTNAISINLTDLNEAPTDVALSNNRVAENQPAGTVVGNFSATDPDAGDAHVFTLVSGTGGTDNASFQIVGNQLRTNAPFDFETKNSFSIRVRATDTGNQLFEKVFTINVTNVDESLVPGDQNGDGKVDIDDLSIVMAARNTQASGLNDPRDLDGDGIITILDARKLVNLM